MSASLLEVQNLSVRFGGLTAVDDVSFAVEAGTVHGLIGPNGAGKTTAFNLISGLTTASRGSVTLGGAKLDGLPTWARAQAGLARTFQNIRMFSDMTVLENVMTGAHLKTSGSLLSILRRGGKFQESEAGWRIAALEFLDFVGLSGSHMRRAGDLSYGDQRRLEIARALASKPQLLMLDEPAAGMNPSEKEDLAQLVQSLRSVKLTILIVEHDMGFMMRLCDQITVLNFGRKIAEGPPGVIRKDAKVIEAYLGHKVARRLDQAERGARPVRQS